MATDLKNTEECSDDASTEFPMIIEIGGVEYFTLGDKAENSDDGSGSGFQTAGSFSSCCYASRPTA